MVNSRFTVDVLAPDYKSKIGTFAPENLLSASCSWLWWSVSTATIYVREEGEEAAQLLLNNVIPVPVTMKAEGYPRWDGYVVYSALTKKAGQVGRITATMVSNRKWVDRLLAAPVPGSPWSNQAGSEYDTRTGPLETVVRQYMTANVARVEASGVDLPLVVTPPPSPDNSPVITIEARNQSVRDEVEATIEANGYDIVSYLWLPGDPQPAGMTLTQSSVVLTVVGRQEKNWVHFTDTSGGISEATVSVSVPQATAVIIGGPGEGTARQFNYVRATAPTPPRTQSAQLILDRLELVVPARTRAAKVILDRINSGQDYNPDNWLWDDIEPLYQRLVPGNAQSLNNSFRAAGGNPADRTSATGWLQNYVTANGGVSTLPVPDRTKAAQEILQRISSDSPYFSNWTWVGASQLVIDYAPSLLQVFSGDPMNEAQSIPALINHISIYDGQEMLDGWRWYDMPILAGMHRAELVALYRGDTNNWPASRAWLQSYIDQNSNVGVELPPGMYGESFYESTGDLDTETRISRGRDRLAELSGKVAMNIQIEDGRPWRAGPDRDYWTGSYVRATFNNVDTADYITRVTLADNSEGFKVSAQLGDGNMTETSDIRLANVVRQLSQEVASLKAKR